MLIMHSIIQVLLLLIRKHLEFKHANCIGIYIVHGGSKYKRSLFARNKGNNKLFIFIFFAKTIFCQAMLEMSYYKTIYYLIDFIPYLLSIFVSYSNY